MTRDVLRRGALAAVAVIVLAGLLGACGDSRSEGSVASADAEAQERGSEDRDHPTPTPALPERETGCDAEPSVDAARTVATGSLAMVDRPSATSLSEISASAPTVVVGDIVGVEQGEARALEPEADALPEAPEPEPEVQLMADILVEVDHAEGQAASSLAPGQTIAVPLTLLAEAPADEAYADYRDTTHANLVNDLRCALPKVRAAVFVARLDPAPASGKPRRAELPTIFWMTDPAAVVLQADGQSVASLDASIPVDSASYFAGATTVEDLVAGIR